MRSTRRSGGVRSAALWAATSADRHPGPPAAPAPRSRRRRPRPHRPGPRTALRAPPARRCTSRARRSGMNGAHDDCRDCGHWSDCATRNEPAFPAGPGDGDARAGLIGDGAPGLAPIHAGDQYISHAQFDLTAIPPAPIPAADRARLVQQMARAFGVPLTVVDPHRMRVELELRTEPHTLLPVETGAVRGVREGSTVAGFRSSADGWAGSAPT